MARKSPTTDAPPAGMDDFPPGDSATQPVAESPTASPRQYPKTEWSDPEEHLCDYGEGRASGATLAAVMAMKLDTNQLRREVDRCLGVKRLFPRIGSRKKLRELREQLAEVATRTEQEIARKEQEIADILRRHKAEIFALRQERETIEAQVNDMASAQESIDRLIPEEVRTARFHARHSLLNDSDVVNRLQKAKGDVQFVKVVTHKDYFRPGLMYPDWFFNPQSLGYLGIERPEFRPVDRSLEYDKDGNVVRVETDHNYEAVRPAFDKRCEELLAMLPALEQELADAQAAYDLAMADIERRVAHFSYVPEE